MATVDDVQNEANANKLATLQAMAAGNTDPYGSGQSKVQQSQSDALGQLAQNATGVNAPSGVVDQLTPTVAGPGNAALAALASQSDPYAADLSAINATGVAGGSGVAPTGVTAPTGYGRQFPVQYYGPYARYGGFGSQSEFDDAVQAEARQRAADDYQHYTGAAEGMQTDLAKYGHGLASIGPVGGFGGGPAAVDPRAASLGLGNAMPQPAPVTTDRELGMGIFRPAAPTPEQIGAERHPFEAKLMNAAKVTGQEAADPLGLFRYAQQTAVDHGAAPMYSKGHFSPEWALDLALKDLAGPNNYAQATNDYQQRQSNGGMTDSELHNDQAARDALAASAVKSTPEYQAGQLSIAGILQQEQGGTQTPMSADGLRIVLIKQGLPPDVIVQLLKDYSPAFVGGAAANALDPNGLTQLYGAQQQTGP